MNSSSLSGRSNILVYSKQVAGIVLFLQSGQPLVIVAVGGLDSRFPLIVHHEVRVGAFKIERMYGFPVVAHPLLQERSFGPIGIDTHDDH